MKNSLIKLSVGTLLLGFLLLAGYRYGTGVKPSRGAISVSDARVCLENGEKVYFNVTLGTQSYLRKMGEWERAEKRSRFSQAFVVSANTHVGTIRDLSLDNKVFLSSDGTVYPSSGKPLGSTTHHNTYIVFFPKYDMKGIPLFEKEKGSLKIIIKDIGRIKERNFTFQHPLLTGKTSSPVKILSLLGTVMAALLISCTPCLMGSLAVGSFTMGTAWGKTESGVDVSRRIKKEMTRKTLYYLVSVTLCYLAVAAAINVLKLSVDDLRPVEIMGGVVLLGIGISLLFQTNPIGAGASSSLGGSLAMVCSVAGAPTLSTAIILPVMVYAGMESFSWAVLILLVYLLVCAVPFFLFAMGLGEILYSASLRLRRHLLIANSFVLISMGFLLMLAQERVADVISAPAEFFLKVFQWMV